MTQKHSTERSLLFPLSLPTRLKTYPCQVAARPWLSLRALLSSPRKGHNTNLPSSRHIREANKKMNVCAGRAPRVPIPDMPRTPRVTEPLSPRHSGFPAIIWSRGWTWGQLPISCEAAGHEGPHSHESTPLHLSEPGLGVPMAGPLPGAGEAQEEKGLLASNAHPCCSGWWSYYFCVSFSPRDPWQDLINQEIRVAFAKARQSTAGPGSSGKAFAGP